MLLLLLLFSRFVENKKKFYIWELKLVQSGKKTIWRSTKKKRKIVSLFLDYSCGKVSFVLFNIIILSIIYIELLFSKVCVIQSCTTYSPRAKCGPRKLLIWPAELKILLILSAIFMKTFLFCVKTY
jgi:hypothetical protein